MKRKQIDLSRLRHNLQQIDIPVETIHVPGRMGRDDLDEAYHLAAAVLTTFDPWQLRPFGLVEETIGTAVERLLANSTLRYDEQGQPRWALNHDARQQALARLGTRERLLAALALAAERPTERLQSMFEAYVRGTARPLAQQSLTDLRHTFQIINWLSGTTLAADLPSSDAIQARISWEELMQPFRYLVAEGFYGREEILAELSEHVESETGPPPVLLFGPGGVGKSTVLAEFVLRQVDRRDLTDRLAFTYVDFDQAFVDSQEPLTILMVAARQLAVQFPDIALQCQKFIKEWSYRLAAEALRVDQNIMVEQKIGHVAPGAEVLGVKVSKVQPRGQFKSIYRYLEDFYNLWAQLALNGRPWLLVLDTFEEVQLRSRDVVRVIGDFLEELCLRIPETRVVIAGRGHTEELSHTPKELEGFDEESAIAFLANQGVTNPVLARQVFRAVTGNPLSLKLAAQVVRQEKLVAVEDTAALQDMLRKVAEGNIQGQLYRRILDHIDDTDVRKLAHPGLTLRFITPELIEQVLAGPCQVTIRPHTDDAQKLFDRLSQEVSLVTPVGFNILRHRPDVRALMITALHNDRPLVVQDIHSTAVAYYEQRTAATDRAEEIYHRLFIEQDFAVIDLRWEPQFHETLDRLLRPALYEIPPRARAWLASRLSLTGVEDINWDETGLPEWERYIERRVRDLIQSNDWTGALALLHQRRERLVGSQLYFLETTILRQQNRWEEARRCAYEGLYSLKMAGDKVRLLDLLRQVIAIDLHLGHVAQAQEELVQARKLLADQKYPDEIVALELDVFELKIEKHANTSAGTKEQIRYAVLQRFESLSERELFSHPQLIRDILIELGSESTAVLQKGLRLMTFGDLTDNNRRALARAMEVWDLALSGTLSNPPGVLLREVSPSLPFEAGWQTYFEETSAARITRDVERLLQKYGDLAIHDISLIGGDVDYVDEDAEIHHVSLEQEITGTNLVGGSIISAAFDDL